MSDVGKLWCWIAQDPLYKVMAEIYLFFFSMITVATSILLRMCTRGGLWCEWPYKRGTTIIDYRPIYNVHRVYTIDWAYISDISHSMYHVIYIQRASIKLTIFVIFYQLTFFTLLREVAILREFGGCLKKN